MAQPPRVLHCKMNSCFFYHNYPEDSETPHSGGLAICHYPENDLVVEYRSCPFYKLNWLKNLKNIPKKKNPESQ